MIDDEGKKTTKATSVFSKHEDADFQKAFSDLIESAYSELFQLHGKDAWALPSNKLISFFRGADQTSSIVGQRQASTFQTFAGLSGHGDLPTAKPTADAPTKKASAAKAVKKEKAQNNGAATAIQHGSGGSADVGLTVRIEINLPVAGDQKTYDMIFKSIRENLLRGQ